MDDLPEIKTGDPIPEGPYTEVLPDGTRRHVFAGLNYRAPLTPLTRRQRANWWLRRHWGWLAVPAITGACLPFEPRLVHALEVEAALAALAVGRALLRRRRRR